MLKLDPIEKDLKALPVTLGVAGMLVEQRDLLNSRVFKPRIVEFKIVKSKVC